MKTGNVRSLRGPIDQFLQETIQRPLLGHLQKQAACQVRLNLTFDEWFHFTTMSTPYDFFNSRLRFFVAIKFRGFAAHEGFLIDIAAS